MNYPEAIEKLKAAHFYPVVNKDKDNKKEVITGLQIACNSLTWESKKEVIIKAIGDKWKIQYVPNELHILITKN